MPLIQNYFRYLYSCPIVPLTGYTAACGLEGTIYAYLNLGGATGTCKDALAEGMLALAADRGELRPGQPLYEVNGENFGTALAVAGARSGHPVNLVVHTGLSRERRVLLKGLGVHFIESSSPDRRLREELAKKAAKDSRGYFIDYMNNDDNAEFHRRVTAPSILNACPDLNAIVVGAGSCGTLTGIGEYTRAWNNEIRMIGVEPYESQVLSGGFAAAHNISGIGPDHVPGNFNPHVVDSMVAVTAAEAAEAARQVLLCDGIPAGISAGAVLTAAARLLQQKPGQKLLCVFNGRKQW